MAADTCRCGHPAEYHRHLHDRTYCGACGPVVCRHYRRDRPDRPLLAWLRDRLARVRGHP